MSARKAKRQPKAQQAAFRLARPLPDLFIAGAPPAKPCPFCGDSESIKLEFKGEPAKRCAVCWCEVCGAEAQHAYPHDGEDDNQLAFHAMKHWNTRKGGVS